MPPLTSAVPLHSFLYLSKEAFFLASLISCFAYGVLMEWQQLLLFMSGGRDGSTIKLLCQMLLALATGYLACSLLTLNKL